MSSPSSLISGLLVTANVGTVSGSWPIKIGKLPTSPHATIAIMDTPGRAPNPKWLIDFPSVQVIVRGGIDEYAEAYNKSAEIRDVLLGADAIDVNDDRIDSITMAGDINSIGHDDTSRPMFSLNFRLIIERPTNALTRRELLPS